MPAAESGTLSSRRWAATLGRWAADEAPALPLPGRGQTDARLSELARLAGGDLAFARLAEGHADALAILDEAGRKPAPEAGLDGSPARRAVYGVWAARGAGGDLEATPTATGWRVAGTKAFCSGAGSLDRALVTADAPDGPRLFDVELRPDSWQIVEGSWPSIGMASSDSYSVELALDVDRAASVGTPGFYTSRPGFWWGAIGVAACWYGGAEAVVGGVADYLGAARPGSGDLAAFGCLEARLVAMRETLRWAASVVDGEGATVRSARRAALVTREVVHSGCVEVLAGAPAAGGARPLSLDGDQGRRSADLYVYLAQHHGSRDAGVLGAETVEARCEST